MCNGRKMYGVYFINSIYRIKIWYRKDAMIKGN